MDEKSEWLLKEVTRILEIQRCNNERIKQEVKGLYILGRLGCDAEWKLPSFEV